MAIIYLMGTLYDNNVLMGIFYDNNVFYGNTLWQ